jgi:hypothetical protein
MGLGIRDGGLLLRLFRTNECGCKRVKKDEGREGNDISWKRAFYITRDRLGWQREGRYFVYSLHGIPQIVIHRFWDGKEKYGVLLLSLLYEFVVFKACSCDAASISSIALYSFLR